MTDEQHSPGRPPRDTAARVLDIAQRLTQTRGFHGFSYADIATELGTTTTAVHYHYRSKAELGHALIDRYSHAFLDALAAIDASGDTAFNRLAAYRDLYLDVVEQRRVCLCGMLAAESESLDPASRASLTSFFDENVAWLERLLARGASDGSITTTRNPRDAAEAIVSALEGMMLLAWVASDPDRFRRASDHLLAGYRA